jgi:RNA polymerase sigma-70 factor, ECF subfamily
MHRREAGRADGDKELEALRRHGFGVAYRMLGSVSEAEDVAQEALLRLTRQEVPIDEPAAWMTKVATRLSINVLKSARARRESYVGPWLPEPLLEDPAPDPASRAELADSLSLALLVLLERLTPVERAAYLLREVFGYEYAEIARIIERTEANARQLVTRARKHIEARRPRFDADSAARDVLFERFLAAAEEGDLEALEQLLAKDAVLYADGGGKAMATPEPLFGAAVIARFMAGVAQVRRAFGEFETRLVRVNGQPGRLLRGPGEERYGQAERLAVEKALALLKAGDVDPKELAAVVLDAPDLAGRRQTTRAVAQGRAELHVRDVLTVDVVEGRIQTVRIVRNPDKLRHLGGVTGRPAALSDQRTAERDQGDHPA